MSVLRTPSKPARGWKPLQRGRVLARATFPDYIEADGERFFQTGKLIVNALSQFSKCVLDLQLDRLEAFYAADFSGSSLGLTQRLPKSQRDGILEYAFQRDEVSFSKKQALAEWRAYIESFDKQEEFALHLNRLENWSVEGPLTGSVRFEHIGTAQ